MTDLLTEKNLKPLLAKKVREAGSQMKLAQGNQSKQVTISKVLAGKRPASTRIILDVLGLEMVFREKPKRRASSR